MLRVFRRINAVFSRSFAVKYKINKNYIIIQFVDIKLVAYIARKIDDIALFNCELTSVIKCVGCTTGQNVGKNIAMPVFNMAYSRNFLCITSGKGPSKTNTSLCGCGLSPSVIFY